MMICEIEQAVCEDLGYKIVNMKKLQLNNILTPKSWFIQSNILSELLKQNGFTFQNSGFLLKDANEIHNFLYNIPIDFYKKMWRDTEQFVLKESKTKRYAIRSSSAFEDGENNSFAGIYKSYLNQRKVSNMVNSIIKCWQSSFSADLIAYLHTSKIPHVIPCNILIQEMIAPWCGGVLFKSNGKYYISANYGLTKSVVDGSYETDMYLVDNENVYSKIRNKEYILISSPRKENPLKFEKLLFQTPKNNISVLVAENCNYKDVLSVKVPKAFANEPCLDHKDIKNLIEIGDKSARIVGLVDYDMEWSITLDGNVVVLQIRALSRAISGRLELKKGFSDDSLGLVEGFSVGITYYVENEKTAMMFPRGAILVAKKLDSFALRALPKASGCIVQSTSILSHSAILAREFNIPTIGVNDISKIPIGRKIELNGRTGEYWSKERIV